MRVQVSGASGTGAERRGEEMPAAVRAVRGEAVVNASLRDAPPRPPMEEI